MPDPPESTDLPASAARGTLWLAGGICLLLTALVWMVFGQTLRFEFVTYDDPAVYDNPEVAKGLTLGGVVWAFTHTQIGHWDPLTTLSHMLVSQICGLAPGGHHWGNVLLHGMGAILLFLVLWRMTSALWRSAFVAAVFAIHPLRVESVAWVTERKDVLSGVFFMLTLAAYARYVRQPQSTARYVMVAVLFALGLMSKSMLVTLPFVLLLLDYWPLGRFAQTCSGQGFLPTLWSLVREKFPLLAMSALGAVIQLFANQESIISSEKMPFLTRAGNALVSYADYIGQMFYPANLAVFYPHPENTLLAWQITLSAVLLISISTAALALRKRRPYFLIGWLWYLGMLVPVIGLVQSGELARADRYTYLPQIGLCLMLAWAAVDLCAGLRHRLLLLGSLSGIVIAALTLAAHRQASYWRDTTALWNHALASDPKNWLAHIFLAIELERKDRYTEAASHLRRALEIKPDYATAHNNLGVNLLHNGESVEAISHLQKAIEIKPDDAATHNTLANAFVETGKLEEAIHHYRKAIEIKPDFAEAEANLANALFSTGHVANAIVHYEKALEIQPGYAEAHSNLASAMIQTGRIREAVGHLQKAVALTPDSAFAHANLADGLLLSGAAADAVPHFQRALDLQPRFPSAQTALAWVLATHPNAALRDGPRAVTLAEQASKAADENTGRILRTLAAAYAEAGRFPEAIQIAQRALELPETRSNTALRESLRTQLEIYRSGSPFHEEPALSETERAQREFERLGSGVQKAPW